MKKVKRFKKIIVALTDRNPQWHDIYRPTWSAARNAAAPTSSRFLGVSVDNDYRVRQATQMTAEGAVEIYVPAGADWVLWDTIPADDALTTGVIGFDQANRLVFLKDSRGRSTAALVAIDPDTKMVQLLAEDPQADAERCRAAPHREKHPGLFICLRSQTLADP